jgi:predicted ATPase
VAPGIAAALRLSPAPDTDPLEQVVVFLRSEQGAPTLLLLDNLEQLLAADDATSRAGGHGVPDAARVVSVLLERVPGLACLCTSRRRLGINGEQEFPLDPLPVPVAGAPLEHLLRFPSVQLYVDRAQAVRPDFQLTPGNADAVAGLCRQMEGIPLAIELAAAWVRTLPPRAMRERLKDRLSIPEARERDLPPRHRSLRAVLDGSFFLLSPAQQRLFARLSVFAGGWTLEACQAVCQEPGCTGALPGAPVLLAELQEASLAGCAEEASGAVRYRFLETIRAYAGERLRDSGEEAALRGRHRDWFVSFARRAGASLHGSESERWLDRLEAEHANLRAALLWCLADEDGMEAALPLLRTLFWFWYRRGHVGEGRELYTGVLSRMGASGLTQKMAELVLEAGGLAYRQGDYASARSLFQETLRLSRDLGDEVGAAHTLNYLGLVELVQGDFAAARSYYEEALPIHQRNGVEAGVAWSLGGLGHVARFEGDYDRARSFYEMALPIFRNRRPALASGVAHALMLMNLGHVARLTGDFDQARSRYEESLRLLAGVGDRSALTSCLEGCACLAAGEGQAARAARLFGAAHAFRETMDVPLPPVDRPGYEAPLNAARLGLGEEAFLTAWTEGRAMTLERAIAFALEGQRRL